MSQSRNHVAHNEGFTNRVLVSDNTILAHPFQALIRPDEDLTGLFVAWIPGRRVFITLDGGECYIVPVH